METDKPDEEPKKGRAKSGEARMSKMTPAERRELAKKAAAKRWAVTKSEVMPFICGSEDHPADIAGVNVPCYVVGDERRVITVSGVQQVLGMGPGGGTTRLVEFAIRLLDKPLEQNELALRLNSPLRFQSPAGGQPASGYDGDIIVDICDAILLARREGRLTARYQTYADRAEVLLSSFAKTAIVALIDEATGFQYIRSRSALSDILRRYISEKLMPWTKTFPDEFYILMFKLKGWDFTNLRPGGHKPSIVGRYTRNIVYQRLAPAVIHDLERKNPTIAPGVRGHKHHQYLTTEIGHPELRLHIEKVLMVMRMADDWQDFRGKLRRAIPMKWEQWEFPDLLPDPPSDSPPSSEDGLD